MNEFIVENIHSSCNAITITTTITQFRYWIAVLTYKELIYMFSGFLFFPPILYTMNGMNYIQTVPFGL